VSFIMTLKVLLLALAVLTPFSLAADQGVAFGVPVVRLTDHPDSWFNTDQGRKTVDNIVTWQNANGGWWKTYDATHARPTTVPNRAESGPKGDDDDVWHKVSTIDNNATYSELRIVARAARVLKDDKFKDSFNRGLKYLFDAQYNNGGWPQRFPLQDNYGRHITFNDDAMLGVMRLLKDVVNNPPDFAFVSDADRRHAAEAFDKGIDCILNCQVKIDGKLTIWCQQHDEQTLAPAGARAYELPSLTGGESSGLTLLLMGIDHPNDRVKRAIEASVAWYQANKITGKRFAHLTGPQYEGGRDSMLVDDPSAPPIWARFYDLETGKPFFCGRDGVKRSALDQVGRERRNGYAWYGTWGKRVLDEYPRWQARVAQN
jgi:PelA/Pel-15E family pectate lyase